MAESRGNCPRSPECPYLLAHIDFCCTLVRGQAASRFSEKERSPQPLGQERRGGLRQWRCAHLAVLDEVLDVIMAVTQDFRLHWIDHRALTSPMWHGKEECLL